VATQVAWQRYLEICKFWRLCDCRSRF